MIPYKHENVPIFFHLKSGLIHKKKFFFFISCKTFYDLLFVLVNEKKKDEMLREKT